MNKKELTEDDVIVKKYTLLNYVTGVAILISEELEEALKGKAQFNGKAKGSLLQIKKHGMNLIKIGQKGAKFNENDLKNSKNNSIRLKEILYEIMGIEKKEVVSVENEKYNNPLLDSLSYTFIPRINNLKELSEDKNVNQVVLQNRASELISLLIILRDNNPKEADNISEYIVSINEILGVKAN